VKIKDSFLILLGMFWNLMYCFGIPVIGALLQKERTNWTGRRTGVAIGPEQPATLLMTGHKVSHCHQDKKEGNATIMMTKVGDSPRRNVRDKNREDSDVVTRLNSQWVDGRKPLAQHVPIPP
jgi:hypothetical protein